MTSMTEVEAALSAQLDRFIDFARTRNRAVIDMLWGDGDFIMVGSEVGEVCRTKPELTAKWEALFALPAKLVFDFPSRTVRQVGSVAWVFADGTITMVAPDGGETTGPYLLCCIFENVASGWRWRQFFGSEPR